MMMGFTDGETKFGKNIAKNVKRIAKKYKAANLTGYVTTQWEHGQFTDPYLRDTLQDFNIMIDTLECTVNWDNMGKVYEEVRKYCLSRPKTFVTTHMSHVYPQGANLYFIFITPEKDMDVFKEYHSGLLAAIQRAGAAMSHHHGIGKLFAPFLPYSIGINEFEVFKTLKNHFDPNSIMNPGGTLALDIPEEGLVNTGGNVHTRH